MKHSFLAVFAAVGVTAVCAQQPYEGGLESVRAEKRGDRLYVEAVLDPAAAGITANERLTLTPAVVKGRDTLRLEPVVLEGRIRYKYNRRAAFLGGRDIPVEDGTVVVEGRRRRARETDETMVYAESVPFRPWMNGAKVVMLRELAGCGGSRERLRTLPLAHLPVPVAPRVTFLVPEREQTKRRADSVAARIHFPQGKYALLRDFDGNGPELGRIDSLTAAVTGDEGLAVEEVYLCGYASPEGTYAYNTRLSANRMETLKNYLCRNFPLSDTLFVTESVPEDWDSLRSWLAASDMEGADEVVAIIDGEPDPDARDARIRALDGGRTYGWLLRNVYPDLRRVYYRIGYVVPPFDVERARAEMRRNPRRLSVHEFYRVADSYGKDDPRRGEVWYAAAQTYPGDVCACNNAAATAIGRGDFGRARRYLRGMEREPRCLNNLAIVLLNEGYGAEAEQCLRRAAAGGDANAKYNLANLENLAAN